MLLTFTFKTGQSGVINLHSLTSDEKLDILWEDIQEIMNEAYGSSLKELINTEIALRQPIYFRLETKDRNIDVCVQLH